MTLLRPDLAIFDCDGVIVDSEELTCRVVAQELTAIGWRTETSEVADRFIAAVCPRLPKPRASGAAYCPTTGWRTPMR